MSRPRAMGDVRPIALVAMGQVLAGVLVGLVWLAWSPQTTAYLLPSSGKAGSNAGSVVIPAETESRIAGDGRFFVLCAVLGVVVGVLAWVWGRRSRGPLMLASIAVGGVLSAVVASRVGSALSQGRTHPGLSTAFHPGLRLHSATMLCAEAFFAVLVYAALAGMSNDEAFVAGPGPAEPKAAATETVGTQTAGAESAGTQIAGAESAGTGLSGSVREKP